MYFGDMKYNGLRFDKRQYINSLEMKKGVIRSYKMNRQLVIILSEPFYIYNGDDKLHFDPIIIMSSLYQTNTLIWIVI